MKIRKRLDQEFALPESMENSELMFSEMESGIEESSSRDRKSVKRTKGKRDAKSMHRQKVDTLSARDLALDYLSIWQNERSSWKFQKVRQIWLLKHLFDKVQVPKESFRILLSYLAGLQGKAKEILLADAAKIMEVDSKSLTARRRAKKVIQILQ